MNGIAAHLAQTAADASVFQYNRRKISRVRHGQSLVVHCRGGLGRTGLISARLLIELGESPARALARVRAARPGAVETREQETYVLEQVSPP